MAVDIDLTGVQLKRGVEVKPKAYDQRFYRRCGGNVGMRNWDGIELRPWHQRLLIRVCDFLGIELDCHVSRVRFWCF